MKVSVAKKTELYEQGEDGFAKNEGENIKKLMIKS